MTGLIRHLRARRVPTALLAAATAVFSLWGFWIAADTGTVPPAITMAAAGFAAIAVGITLAGADEEWERSAAVRWPPRRALHLLVGSVAILGLLFSVSASPTGYGDAALVLRDTAGSVGLIMIGTTILGAARAWLPLVPWITIPPVLPYRHPGDNALEQILTWPLRPADSATAAGTAAVLLLLGALCYIVRGSRPVASVEAAVAR